MASDAALDSSAPQVSSSEFRTLVQEATTSSVQPLLQHLVAIDGMLRDSIRSDSLQANGGCHVNKCGTMHSQSPLLPQDKAPVSAVEKLEPLPQDQDDAPQAHGELSRQRTTFSVQEVPNEHDEMDMQAHGTLRHLLSGEIGNDEIEGKGKSPKNNDPFFLKYVNDMRTSAEIDFTKGKEVDERLVLALQCLTKVTTKLQEPERTGVLAGIITSQRFDKLVAAVITLDTIIVAFGTDWEMKNPLADVPLFFRLTSWIFLVIYSIELVLRFAVHRMYFFINQDFFWNIFDTSVVVISWVKTLLELIFMHSTAPSNLNMMRIIRVLKIVKILRTVRVIKFLRELRMMLISLRDSMCPLFWTFSMLILTLYSFSLVFMQAMSGHLSNPDFIEQLPYSDKHQIFKEEVEYYFGSLESTMLTLYKSVSGGSDWEKYYDIVQTAGKFYAFFFVCFTFFFTYALFNLLTAVFVEKAVSAARPDREKDAMKKRRLMVKETEKLKRMLRMLSDENLMISRDIFEKSMDHEAMQAFFLARDVEVGDVHMFFDLVAGGAGVDAVPFERFVDGCLHMRGVATGVEMQQLLFMTEMLRVDMQRLNVAIPNALDSMNQANGMAMANTVDPKDRFSL